MLTATPTSQVACMDLTRTGLGSKLRFIAEAVGQSKVAASCARCRCGSPRRASPASIHSVSAASCGVAASLYRATTWPRPCAPPGWSTGSVASLACYLLHAHTVNACVHSWHERAPLNVVLRTRSTTGWPAPARLESCCCGWQSCCAPVQTTRRALSPTCGACRSWRRRWRRGASGASSCGARELSAAHGGVSWAQRPRTELGKPAIAARRSTRSASRRARAWAARVQRLHIFGQAKKPGGKLAQPRKSVPWTTEGMRRTRPLVARTQYSSATPTTAAPETRPRGRRRGAGGRTSQCRQQTPPARARQRPTRCGLCR